MKLLGRDQSTAYFFNLATKRDRYYYIQSTTSMVRGGAGVNNYGYTAQPLCSAKQQL